MKLRSIALAVACAFCSAGALAGPTFVNGITVDANETDLSNDATLLNRRLGMFSDIYYDTTRAEWWGLSDRGPGGGTLNYDTRVQRFTLDINASTGAIANFQVVETVMFRTAGGQPFNGLASPAPGNVLGQAFDPEGIVVNAKTGRLLVSDEYGPSLYEFNRDGTLARTFTTPANLIPRNAGTGTPNYASDAGNDAGKRTNRGFEGLAISPDGKYSYAMLQSAMLDEGAGDGVNVRIVKFNNETGLAEAQYIYKMDAAGQGKGISALVALNDHEFLVLERNNRGVGVESEMTPQNKKVYKIDISGATDVSAISVGAGALPPGVTPVTKNPTVFIDLGANTLAAMGGRVPEKWEGLSIGPQLADGQYMILAGTDNDYSITQNANGIQFEIYYNPLAATNGSARIRCDIGTFNNCLVVGANGVVTATPYSGSFDDFAAIPGVLHAYKSTGSDLAGYIAQVPVPGTLPLALAGLGLLGFARRRNA